MHEPFKKKKVRRMHDNTSMCQIKIQQLITQDRMCQIKIQQL